MRPAFSSTRQVVAFCVLLAVIISLPALLPLVVVKTGWFKIRNRYPALGVTTGLENDAYIEQEVFVATNTVDIVFMGASQIWAGINTPYVQQQLTEHLHRDAEVLTLGWSDTGCDLAYFVARDLLDHRHVRLLVVGDEAQADLKPGDTSLTFREHTRPHRAACAWFWRGEELQALGLLQLPLTEIISLYGEAVIDMPRHLLDLARANLPLPAKYMQPNIDVRGAHRWALGWGRDKTKFFPYDPERVEATPADVVVYSKDIREKFAFVGPTWDRYQSYFANRLAELCLERGTKLVVLHLPLPTDTQKTVIPVDARWTEEVDAPVEFIGIPGARLFAGFSPDEVRKFFYYNEWHLNSNGEDLLTPLLTPTLFKFYDASTNHF